ncbi:hybrid sensor histidine kinase/response regulator [Paremcibacter congregatus]|uniref:ATP-binding response regulator n=1 Tax=Paremcibacter congregatus TaxID=2043170 RepID=UPI003A9594DC
MTDHRLSEAEIKRLVMENARLNKTVQVLMDRVEQEMDQQQDSFTIFQTAIKLEETVNLRTNELSDLNTRLMTELAEREIIEEKLQIAKMQAEEANKSKTKFLATASHDLRQPLNAARLFVGSLAAAGLSEDNARNVMRIGNSLDALDDLLSVLLNISQLDSGGIKPRFCHFKLQDLFDRIVPDYMRTGEDRGLDVRMVPTSQIVYSDPRLLETILRNFLSNAVRYTKQGRILIGCRGCGENVTIRILDTGIGIKADQLEGIFEEFTQVHEDRSVGGRGIGLGLSIVQRISKLLDAHIEVRSIFGQGSLFGIILARGNVDQLSQPYAERVADVTPANSLAGRTIAVVDNDEDVLDAMQALLEKWGCRVISGPSADICLAPLITEDITPDIIIADYHLNGDDTGVSAVREIRAEFEGPLPAILITSDRDPDLADLLEQEGLPLIYKPVAAAALHALIQHLLNTPKA